MKSIIKENRAFVLSPQKADEFLKQDNENFKKAMDRFEKHNKTILSPPVNHNVYNSHLVSDDFLDYYTKAGRLFKKNP
jgi:hypothetical protein